MFLRRYPSMPLSVRGWKETIFIDPVWFKRRHCQNPMGFRAGHSPDLGGAGMSSGSGANLPQALGPVLLWDAPSQWTRLLWDPSVRLCCITPSSCPGQNTPKQPPWEQLSQTFAAHRRVKQETPPSLGLRQALSMPQQTCSKEVY